MHEFFCYEKLYRTEYKKIPRNQAELHKTRHRKIKHNGQQKNEKEN